MQKSKWLSGVSKVCIRVLTSSIIRKVGQEEQQNQTNTTNIDYIQNLSRLF